MEVRINRALNERIYLLKAEQLSNNWRFEVKGQSNKIYKVNIINSDKCTCTCMDFILRKNACKHLIFITERIAKISLITYYMINNNQLDSVNFDLLSDKLKDKLISKPIQTDDSKRIAGADEECFICFESLSGETLVQCITTCKNYFHDECLKIWLNNNNTCPLCRAQWVTRKLDDDALTFFTQKSLKPILKLKIKH